MYLKKMISFKYKFFILIVTTIILQLGYNILRDAKFVRAEPPPCIPTGSGNAAHNTGAISFWSGDGTAEDFIDANNGILVGNATYNLNQQAFSLDGESGYVRVLDAPNLSPTGSFSISVWIYPTQDGQRMIMGKWASCGYWVNQREYVLSMWPGLALEFAISDDARQLDSAFHHFMTPNGILALNEWQHIAAVYDQTTGTRYIYVNGNLITSITYPPITITQGIAEVSIGANIVCPSSGAYFFAGMIKNVGFYNKALTVQEIKQLASTR